MTVEGSPHNLPQGGTSAPGDERATGQPQRPGRTHRLAIGINQVFGLFGVVGLAVIAGAILVQDAKTPGWAVGLVIGAGAVILTLVVLFMGRRARRI